MKDDKQQGLVDAVIVSNLNMPQGLIKLTSFDFSLNSAVSIKEI